MADGRLGEKGEDPLGGFFVAVLAAQRREAKQAQRSRAVAGGDRVVADLLAAGDQLFVVGGGRVEAAALGIAEALDRLVGELARRRAPAALEACFVERQQ